MVAGWDAWLEAVRALPLPAVLIAVAALGVPLVMGEMGYNHHRGNFHRLPMFAPVALPPVFMAAAFLFLGTRATWAAWAFGGVALLLVAMGFAGWFFHQQGIARQTGGYQYDNVLVGPPFFAPLAFSFLGLLGLLGLAFWSVGA